MIRFWNLKQHVENWLNENNITNAIVIGLGKGNHGVNIHIFDCTNSEFINKHKQMVTKFYKGYFSAIGYTDSVIYVSMVKNHDKH